MTEVLQFLYDQGVMGIGLIAMGFYLVKKDKYHLQERNEWKEEIRKLNKQLFQTIETNNDRLSELSSVVSGMNIVVTEFLHSTVDLLKNNQKKE